MKKNDKCCGNCCWFYGEMTDGEGFCALRDTSINDTRCDFLCSYELHISRKEMRHHMAVLLNEIRWNRKNAGCFDAPDVHERADAIEFAFRFMKVFGEL